MRKIINMVIFFCFIVAILAGAQPLSEQITITDLGMERIYSDAQDINKWGDVVGWVDEVEGYRAFLWPAEGGAVDLGTLGGEQSEAYGINDSGQIIGFGDVPSHQSEHAFLWTPGAGGGMQDLGTIDNSVGSSSLAFGINKFGEVVGSSQSPLATLGKNHAFLWTPGAGGGMQDLGTLDNTVNWLDSYATDINDLGQVVGWSSRQTGPEHAFLWIAGEEMIDLGTLGGTRSEARGINNSGQVVGQADTASGKHHAFLWTPTPGEGPGVGVMVDLGTLDPGGDSIAYDINDLGHVVGWAESDTEEGYHHAFLWTIEGGMEDLGTLGGFLSEAWGINNSGQAAGWSDPYEWSEEFERNATLWEFDVSPPSPQEQIENIMDEIEGLIESENLSQKDAKPLMEKLDGALKKIEKGNEQAACNQLSAFINQVYAHINAGKLSPETGQDLIDAATDLINEICG